MNDIWKELSYSDAITLAQKEEMSRDENVILIGEDIHLLRDKGVLGTTSENRIWSTPISENSITGIAVGAAMTGLRPIVDLTIASFLYLAADQIINQAAKMYFISGGQMKVPVVIRANMFYGISLAAQHSDRPYPLFMNTPGLKIIVPSTPSDMRGLLKSAIRDNDPVVILGDVNLMNEKGLVSMDPEYQIPIGKADIKKTGEHVTIVSIGGCLSKALAAAEILDSEGISAEIIDPRTLVPLDKEIILASVRKTGRLVIVDNAHRTGSAASEIASVVAEQGFDSLRKPICLVTTPDLHIPFSFMLEKNIYPSKEKIIGATKNIM